MTVGIAAGTANSQLDSELNSTYVQLHTGDPGASGTANVASTTRQAVTFAAASAGSKALSSSSSWTNWADGSVTITHISVWTADSAGTFRRSAALTASQPIVNGNTFTLSTLTVSYTPVAA